MNICKTRSMVVLLLEHWVEILSWDEWHQSVTVDDRPMWVKCLIRPMSVEIISAMYRYVCVSRILQPHVMINERADLNAAIHNFYVLPRLWTLVSRAGDRQFSCQTSKMESPLGHGRSCTHELQAVLLQSTSRCPIPCQCLHFSVEE